MQTNQNNHQSMLAKGGPKASEQEIQARKQEAESRWRELGRAAGRAAAIPQHPNIRPYLEGWLEETQFIADAGAYERFKNTYRYFCTVDHVSSPDFKPFKIVVITAVPSLKALNRVVRTVFGKDVCVTHFEEDC